MDEERQPSREQEDDDRRRGGHERGEPGGDEVGDERAPCLRDRARRPSGGVPSRGERRPGLAGRVGEPRAREREVRVRKVGRERDRELRVGDRAGGQARGERAGGGAQPRPRRARRRFSIAELPPRGEERLRAPRRLARGRRRGARARRSAQRFMSCA